MGTEESESLHHYNLVLTGKVIDGFDRKKVILALAALIKQSEEKAEALLNGKVFCLKKGVTKNDCDKYLKIVTDKGIGAVSQRVDLANNVPKAAAKKALLPETKAVVKNKAKAQTKTEAKTIAKPALALTIAERFQPEKISIALTLYALAAALFVAIIALLYVVLGLGIFAVFIERLVSIFTSSSSLTPVDIVFGHLLPALVILTLFALYLRPLFPKHDASDSSGEEVLAENQPQLFQFLTRLCEVLNVSLPEKILLTSSLKVEAEFLPGVKNFIRGERGLSLGLPLFRILSSTQLAGLVISALWPFSSGRTQFFIGFVRLVYGRFYRVVKGEDGWVEWLTGRQDAAGSLLGKYGFACGSLLLQISSKLFTLFLYLVGAPGANLLKQIQYASDDCQVDLIGSPMRAAIFLTLARGEQARIDAMRKMTNTPGTLRLVSDLAALIEYNVDAQSVPTVKTLEDAMRAHEPKWHEATAGVRDRIIRAEDRNADTKMEAAFDAMELISNYPSISTSVSQNYYESLQMFVNQKELVDVAEYAASAQEEMLREAKVQQYFNGWFKTDLFWLVPPPEKAQTLKLTTKLALLNDAITRLRHGTPEYLKLLNDLPPLKEKLRILSIANEIKKAAYGIPVEYFDPNQNALADFASCYQSTKNEYQNLLQRQQKYCEVMGLRLLLAVSAATSEEDVFLGRKLINILRTIEKLAQHLSKIQMPVSFLPVALARMRDKKEMNHQKRVLRIARDVVNVCDDVIQNLKHLEWPLSDDYANTSEFVLARVKHSPTKDSTSILEKVGYYYDVLKGLEAANQLVNGELAIIAGRSEEFHGIAKIKVALI